MMVILLLPVIAACYSDCELFQENPKSTQREGKNEKQEQNFASVLVMMS